jgi:hypothetical protein
MNNNVKAGKTIFGVRTPDEIAEWLRKQSAYTGATISAIISLACREKMEREQTKARADRVVGE